jgi:general secretion pathway protein I
MMASAPINRGDHGAEQTGCLTQPVRRDRGFTLLEVVVAFIIAAVALASLFQGALAALTAAREAGRYKEATALARSRLEATANSTSLIPGETQGDEGRGYHWRVRVAALATAGPATQGPAAAIAARQDPRTQGTATLYAVTVVVSWHEAGAAGDLKDLPRYVRLDTERLGAQTR